MFLNKYNFVKKIIFYPNKKLSPSFVIRKPIYITKIALLTIFWFVNIYQGFFWWKSINFFNWKNSSRFIILKFLPPTFLSGVKEWRLRGSVCRFGKQAIWSLRCLTNPHLWVFFTFSLILVLRNRFKIVFNQNESSSNTSNLLKLSIKKIE